MKKHDVKMQWVRMLGGMLEDYRQKYPDDERGDTELLTSLMDYFVEKGELKKEGEKYILGELKYDA